MSSSSTSTDRAADPGGELDLLVEAAKRRRRQQALAEDERELLQRALATPDPPDLFTALSGPGLGLIAEFKRRSPRGGNFDLVEIDEQLGAYERGGAAALSILTSRKGFDGSLDDLERAAIICPALPRLRKDFVSSRYEVLEARASGASGILLIARLFRSGQDRLEALILDCGEIGIEPLIECHSLSDLELALASGARLIGVNSRDLESFEIDVEAALDIVAEVPKGRLAIFESGIVRRADAEAARSAGAAAVLVGSALMSASDPEALARELASIP